MFKIESPFKLIASIVICQLAGVIGSFFTVSSISTWYAALVKPTFSPPNWVFVPVWIFLYLLMGIALYLIWVKNSQLAISLFAVQMLLNISWPFLFFGLRAPLLGLIDIILLLLAILISIKVFYKVSKNAAFLFVPYFLWVAFATMLNYGIWILNA